VTALIERYRDLLPVGDATPVVTLGEGGTPLVPLERLSERLGRRAPRTAA
jgi:threonine synthase